jgi:GAF domain
MQGFYDFFIARFKGQEEDYSRARLIINFSLTETFISLFYALVHGQLNFHVPQLLFVSFSVVLILTLIIFRMELSLTIMGHIMITTMWLGFLTGIAFSGGIYSLVLPWLSLMPVMANFLINRKAAKVWAMISAVSVISFMFLFKNQHVMLDDRGDWRALAAHLGLVFIIYYFSNLYGVSKAKLLNALKGSNEDLKDQKEEVLAQNEELIQQRDEIAAQRDHIERQNTLLKQQYTHIERMNEELSRKAKEIFNRNATIEKHWHTLLEVSKSRSINFGDLDEALRYITKTAAKSLQADRVSVWQYDEERNSIRCLVLYERNEDVYTHGEELLGKDFPRYFEALREEQVISADEAETDSHTFEFKDIYLKPRHIESMMDTPYFLDGKLGGVMCCEHLVHRHWLPEDTIFAQALSDIITLVFRATQRREYEAKIREHKKEISRVNLDLEERIKERTAELEAQNNQLAEYAFINSHLLRGPLCRLLGLINLIDHTEIQDKEKDLINHLKLSGEELDEVVKKINSAIEKGGHFDRKEFGNFDRN